MTKKGVFNIVTWEHKKKMRLMLRRDITGVHYKHFTAVTNLTARNMLVGLSHSIHFHPSLVSVRISNSLFQSVGNGANRLAYFMAVLITVISVTDFRQDSHK